MQFSSGPDTAPPAVHTSSKELSDTAIIKQLAGYIWPKGNLDYKLRVTFALALLAGSKVLNIQVCIPGHAIWAPSCDDIARPC